MSEHHDGSHLAPEEDKPADVRLLEHVGGVLMTMDIAYFLVIFITSASPWISLGLAVLFPGVNVPILKLSNKTGKPYISFSLVLTLIPMFLVTYISGPNSPGWILCFSGVAASQFMIKSRRLKQAILAGFISTAVAGSYFAGRESEELVIIFVTLLAFTTILTRIFSYLLRSLDEVEEAKDHLDGVLESVADGLIVTDLQNQVIMMNEAAEDLLEVKYSEVKDNPIDFAIKDQSLRGKIKATLSKRITGDSFDFERDRDGSSKEILRVRTSVVVDKAGQQRGIVTVFHNVTHEREVDRMKSEFISMAAHELRAPLTSIKGYAEILLTRDELQESDKAKFLTYIWEQSEVLSRTISDLLDISRIEVGEDLVLKTERCMVGDVIEQVTQPYIDRLPKNSIRVHLPNAETELFLDKERMAQALGSILSNAVRYSPEKVDVDLTGEIQGGYCHVTVQDRGIGMRPDELERAYDRFYKADTSSTAISGTGLGLSIAKAIIEAHGGEIRIESEFGIGTKVSFKVPIRSTDGF